MRDEKPSNVLANGTSWFRRPPTRLSLKLCGPPLVRWAGVGRLSIANRIPDLHRHAYLIQGEIMPDPYAQIRTRNVAQTVSSDPDQVPNNAGGYVFLTDWKQTLTRFLVLGSTGGTYYATEAAHTDQAV